MAQGYDYSNVEVIVSDNLSTDDTAKIVQEYAGRGVRYTLNPRLHNKYSQVQSAEKWMTPTKPLLSVCIPTYNRAHLLESALYTLAPQIKALAGQVELVVSDNCSPDQTPQVVERAHEWGPIRYFRNEENVDIKNFDLCVERAAGEFVWIVGDDDLVRGDGIHKVLGVLQDHPEVDFVWVNVSTRRNEERERFGRLVSDRDFPELLPTKGTDLTSRLVDRWEELIDPRIDAVFLGSVMCSVFRRTLWLANRSYVQNLELPFSLSAERLYPHSIIFARAMVGRPAWYIGYPCVIAFWGHQEWSGYVPAIMLVTLPQLLDVYLETGIEAWRVARCRRSLLHTAGWPLILMLLRPNLPGREYFSFRKYFLRYGRYKELWIGLLLSLTVGSAKQLVKWIHRVLRPGVSGRDGSQ